MSRIVLANKHMSMDVLPLGAFSIANPDGFGMWVFLISLAAVAAFIYMVYAVGDGRQAAAV